MELDGLLKNYKIEKDKFYELQINIIEQLLKAEEEELGMKYYDFIQTRKYHIEQDGMIVDVDRWEVWGKYETDEYIIKVDCTIYPDQTSCNDKIIYKKSGRVCEVPKKYEKERDKLKHLCLAQKVEFKTRKKAQEFGITLR